MDREQDIPFIVENGAMKPELSLGLRDGTRGTARIRDLVPSDNPPLPDRAAFWQHKTLEELAAEQGVRPITDISELRGDWPPEDSIDEFLAEVRKGRQ